MRTALISVMGTANVQRRIVALKKEVKDAVVSSNQRFTIYMILSALRSLFLKIDTVAEMVSSAMIEVRVPITKHGGAWAFTFQRTPSALVAFRRDFVSPL